MYGIIMMPIIPIPTRCVKTCMILIRWHVISIVGFIASPSGIWYWFTANPYPASCWFGIIRMFMNLI